MDNCFSVLESVAIGEYKPTFAIFSDFKREVRNPDFYGKYPDVKHMHIKHMLCGPRGGLRPIR